MAGALVESRHGSFRCFYKNSTTDAVSRAKSRIVPMTTTAERIGYQAIPKPARWTVHLIAGLKPFVYRGWAGRNARTLKLVRSDNWPRRNTMVKVFCGCGVVEAHQIYKRMFTRSLNLVECFGCKVAWDKAHEAGAVLAEDLTVMIPFETYGTK